MRILLAIVLLGHAFAHLPGFLVFWRLATLKELPYGTTLVAGSIDVGDTGIRVVGILWLIAALGFAACGVGLLARTPWWLSSTVAVSTFSLVLCISGWPAARIGVVVNVAILAFLLADTRVGWLP